jgi:hypothetical protein
MAEPSLVIEPDPVIDAFKTDIDRTLLRKNLKLTIAANPENAVGGGGRAGLAHGGGQEAAPGTVTDFPAAIKLLSVGGVGFIVVGGVAATALGSAHITYDLDVVFRRRC